MESSFSDSNGIRTRNHLVRKRTLNQLYANLVKWLCVRFTNEVVVGTNLVAAF